MHRNTPGQVSSCDVVCLHDYVTSNTATQNLALAGGRMPSAAPADPRYAHTSIGGFCTVCGSVWPCRQARSADLSPGDRLPIAR